MYAQRRYPQCDEEIDESPRVVGFVLLLLYRAWYKFDISRLIERIYVDLYSTGTSNYKCDVDGLSFLKVAREYRTIFASIFSILLASSSGMGSCALCLTRWALASHGIPNAVLGAAIEI